jgi:hypothetical protein
LFYLTATPNQLHYMNNPIVFLLILFIGCLIWLICLISECRVVLRKIWGRIATPYEDEEGEQYPFDDLDNDYPMRANGYPNSYDYNTADKIIRVFHDGTFRSFNHPEQLSPNITDVPYANLFPNDDEKQIEEWLRFLGFTGIEKTQLIIPNQN